MPLTLEQIQHQRKECQLEYAGETVTLIYNPAAATPRFTRGLRIDPDDPDRSITVEALLGMLLAWDVVDGKGKKVPITRELFMELPWDFLNAMSEAINEDMRPGETKGATSGAGSWA